jgi:hypothetical protein
LWLFRIVQQNLADFTDRCVDALLSIEKDLFAPEPLDDSLSGNQLAVMFDQENQQLHRDLLKPQWLTIAFQIVAAQVQFELAEFVARNRRHAALRGPIVHQETYLPLFQLFAALKTILSQT